MTDRGVTWDGWRLPAALALAVVGIAGLVFLRIAIVQFSRTD
jgi:hypothetical protein